MTDLRQVFDDLVRFETVLWGDVDHRLRKECGLSLAALNALLIIDATPQCRVLDIAQALAVSVGGVSQAVDRLETAGHCVRRPNPADRRSSILEVTPEGAALVERAGPVFDDELERLLYRPLDSGALTDLGRMLATLRRTAVAAPMAGGSSPPTD